MEETRHVFLQGNDLPTRWSQANQFNIAELGFGTGLNFLATWELWRSQRNRPALHYYAIELYPLSCQNMKRAHDCFAEIMPLSNQMIAHYPENFETDWHWQVEENFQLTVLWGAADQKLSFMPYAIDAWYLDGFTPAHNPEMWTQNIFNQIAHHSKPQSTFATFTVARMVRNHSEQAGFRLEKRKGFGKKRDMLVGLLP